MRSRQTPNTRDERRRRRLKKEPATEPKRQIIVPDGHKWCSRCSIAKVFAEFSVDKKSRLGLSLWCRECQSVDRRERYKDPEVAERNRRTSRDRYQNPEIKKVLLEKAADRYVKFGEHIRAVNSAWRKRNRERANTLLIAYRAKKKGTPGSHTTQEWKDLCAKFENRCVCCGEEKPLARDHVIPVGLPQSSNSISNIQPLCKSCNSKKHRVRIVDYRPSPFMRTGIPVRL